MANQLGGTKLTNVPNNFITPNVGRVLVHKVEYEELNANSPLLMPGQLKAGENLYLGQVVNPGKTSFVKGQYVYYSEYSAASCVNVGAVQRGEMTIGDALKPDQVLYVVAEDDIMAYEPVPAGGTGDTEKV